MIAKSIINKTIPPLKPQDTAAKALSWMSEFHLLHLPLVSNKKLINIISEYDLMETTDALKTIAEIGLPNHLCMIHEYDHIYEVVRQLKKNQLTIMPVVNEKNEYLGMITQDGLIHFFASAGSVHENGGIIILEITHKDYSLAEIAQIVESNNARILNVFVHDEPQTHKLEVSLKINASDMEEIISTFERYEYTVKAYHEEASYTDHLQDRLDSLMNYLNI